MATGNASVFLPRVFSMPAPDPEKKTAGLDDARTDKRDSEEAKGEDDSDTGSAFSVSVSAESTSVIDRGVRSDSSDQEGAASCAATSKPPGRCSERCERTNGDRTSPESGTYGMPLDIALYSLKAAAGEKAKGLSPVEKLKGLRAFCLHLAGQDPGDVHEALQLECGPNASTNVCVSDGFLKEVCCSMPRLYRPIGCAQYQGYARMVVWRASSPSDEQIQRSQHRLHPCFYFASLNILCLIDFAVCMPGHEIEEY